MSLRYHSRRSFVAMGRLFAHMMVLGLFFTGSAMADAPKGDPAKGKALFARCAMCHTVTKGGPNRIGPNLHGIMGKKAAAIQGFFYSGALKKSGIVWSDEKMALWIAKPGLMVPGNRMAFAGIRNPQQVRDLVAYMKTLK